MRAPIPTVWGEQFTAREKIVIDEAIEHLRKPNASGMIVEIRRLRDGTLEAIAIKRTALARLTR